MRRINQAPIINNKHRQHTAATIIIIKIGNDKPGEDDFWRNEKKKWKKKSEFFLQQKDKIINNYNNSIRSCYKHQQWSCLWSIEQCRSERVLIVNGRVEWLRCRQQWHVGYWWWLWIEWCLWCSYLFVVFWSIEKKIQYFFKKNWNLNKNKLEKR